MFFNTHDSLISVFKSKISGVHRFPVDAVYFFVLPDSLKVLSHKTIGENDCEKDKGDFDYRFHDSRVYCFTPPRS